MTETARNAGGAGDVRAHKSVHELIESHDFKAMVSKRWTVSIVLLVALFVTYYGYILLVGMNKESLAQKIGEYTTLGIPLGVAVIVIAFILTGIYIVWANQKYDPEVERLKGQLKH
jgi:uncharacterized membrane protein (DUF485 family)